MSGHPQRGVFDDLILIVQDGEDLPCGRGAGEIPQATFADHHATALAIANKVDDVHPATFEFWELEVASHAS